MPNGQRNRIPGFRRSSFSEDDNRDELASTVTSEAFSEGGKRTTEAGLPAELASTVTSEAFSKGGKRATEAGLPAELASKASNVNIESPGLFIPLCYHALFILGLHIFVLTISQPMQRETSKYILGIIIFLEK